MNIVINTDCGRSRGSIAETKAIRIGRPIFPGKASVDFRYRVTSKNSKTVKQMMNLKRIQMAIYSWNILFVVP